MREPVAAPEVPAPAGPYSPGLVVGDFVFVSGQGPVKPDTGKLVGPGIEEQTRQALDNVNTILEAAGSSMNEVVKVTVVLTDLALFPRMNAIYRSFFQEPFPTRTTFGGALAIDGMLVEIDAIARKP